MVGMLQGGNLYTSHVLNKKGIKSRLTITTSHKYKLNIHHPECNQGPTTEPNKERQPQMLDPRSPRLGPTTDQLETKQHNEHGLHRAPI